MDRRQEHLDSPAFLLDTLALAYCLIGLSDKGFSQLEATQLDWFIRFLYPPLYPEAPYPAFFRFCSLLVAR